MLTLQNNVPLAPLTTLRLGGPADAFALCTSVDDLRDALRHAAARSVPLYVLGGGSNTIIPDDGVRGMVARIALRGLRQTDDGEHVLLDAAAGEPWDELVAGTVEEGLGGLECLSGIPGLAGATPIQNVGAYGQEVRQTIRNVTLLDRASLREVALHAEECGFGYRQSRFKGADAGRFIVTSVRFRLRKNGAPEIRYPELAKALEVSPDRPTPAAGRPGLQRVRDAVLSLRRRKSMVIDPKDPNTRSVGSFFMNPVVSRERFAEVRRRWTEAADSIPTFPAGDGVKIPAAWLVEHSGFARGHRHRGAGISEHHALALVNRGGTTTDLLELASAIEQAVSARFGIRLEREAVLFR